jgi:hypothetical protein
MPPPSATPEQIILYGKRQSRLIHLEANVIGYFGHIFRQKLSGSAAARSVTAVRVPGALSL